MKGNGACTEPLGGWEQVCSACLQAVKLGLMRRSHRRQILDWHERLFFLVELLTFQAALRGVSSPSLGPLEQKNDSLK